MSHRASLLGRGYLDSHLDSPRTRFRRALMLCLLTVAVPGSAHLAVGRKRIGRIALTLWVLALVGGACLLVKYATDRAEVIGWFTGADVLLATRITIVVVALLWGLLFLDAWRLASPFQLTFFRAALVTVLNVAIVAGVASSTAYATRAIQEGDKAIGGVFLEKPEPQAKVEPLKGRFNILLVGSDAREDRTGVRPDSLTVASIDADTGKVVLVSLPRNLQNVPFSEGSPMRKVYPYGYNCGPTCLLNAVHTAAQNRTDLYPDSKDPGLDATIDAVEGATSLRINYYVMVNLNGFKGLVDALGGVEMDVKTRIAMFGHDDAYKNTYIEVGKQKLDGQQSLWYARSRVQSDDYTRMGRQKCLMAAMADQLTPSKVVRNAVKIARSGKELLSTSIPRSELGRFADLALKSRGNKIRTVSIVPPRFSPVTPDYVAIHAAVQKAIDKSEGTLPASPDKDPSGRASNNSDDLAATC